MDYVEIHWTCDTMDEAQMAAQALINEKLVACANILPHIESVYVWDGAVERGREVKVFFKTLPELVEEVALRIKELSSYDVPEISCVELKSLNADYLSWMRESLGS
jgi:periplasmic divalent cation tolerance protein